MDNKTQLFIKTTDRDTANQLIALGFQLINHDTATWTFLNESKSLNFDGIKSKKVAFSNTLTI